jgi:predicted nucleic acid-binding protein
MSVLPLWLPSPTGPPTFVLDVSVTLAWSFAAKPTKYTSDVMMKMSSTVVTVPVSWPLELTDALHKAVRAGRGTLAQVDRFLRDLYVFHFVIDRETPARAWADILPLARTYSVPMTRAAYLELALRLRLPLATADITLTRAATAANVPVYIP